MNGFFLNQLLPVSTGWIPDPDRDKSGTPHRDKPGGAFEVLENQALQVGCSNQAEREGNYFGSSPTHYQIGCYGDNVISHRDLCLSARITFDQGLSLSLSVIGTPCQSH